MTIDKESFFSLIAKPLREKVVEVDGNSFRLREMTEEQNTQYELALQDKKGGFDYTKARRTMIALMLVDDAGNRIIDDESQIKQMPRSLAGVLFDECQRLNRYEPGEVKALVKNSDEAAA
jgi:hypothetical protein